MDEQEEMRKMDRETTDHPTDLTISWRTFLSHADDERSKSNPISLRPVVIRSVQKEQTNSSHIVSVIG